MTITTHNSTREEILASRLSQLLTIATEGSLDIQWAERYGEPGYSDPDSKVILFADWNTVRCDPITPENRHRSQNVISRIGKLAEKLGAECEWSDEWYTCSCGAAIRSQPDHYGWLPSFVYSDGEIDCKTCMLDDPANYVDSYLLGNTERADTFGVDLSTLGFRHVDGGESGFHEGQNDNPTSMVLAGVPPEHEYVFQIDGTGQFDVKFSLWIRPNYDDGFSLVTVDGVRILTVWEDHTEPATRVERYPPGHVLAPQIISLRSDGFRRIDT